MTVGANTSSFLSVSWTRTHSTLWHFRSSWRSRSVFSMSNANLSTSLYPHLPLQPLPTYLPLLQRKAPTKEARVVAFSRFHPLECFPSHHLHPRTRKATQSCHQWTTMPAENRLPSGARAIGARWTTSLQMSSALSKGRATTEVYQWAEKSFTFWWKLDLINFMLFIGWSITRLCRCQTGWHWSAIPESMCSRCQVLLTTWSDRPSKCWWTVNSTTNPWYASHSVLIFSVAFSSRLNGESN